MVEKMEFPELDVIFPATNGLVGTLCTVLGYQALKQSKGPIAVFLLPFGIGLVITSYIMIAWEYGLIKRQLAKGLQKIGMRAKKPKVV